MFNNKKVLAIILARGGSKRLPNKNILNLCGKQMIVWSIEAAFGSKYIDNVIVSSNDSEILSISKKAGANTISRPEYLALDTSTSIDAIEHVLLNINDNFGYTILLQPTSPMRNSSHIDEAINMYEDSNIDSIISVTKAEHSPLWSNILPPDGSMDKFLNKQFINIRSQDLPVYYRLNGAIYICKTEILLKCKTFFLNKNVYSYIMDNDVSIDIDDEKDFYVAEKLMSKI